MEDLVLRANLEDGVTLYVSPIDRQTYVEHVQDDNLGGGEGYFLMRSLRQESGERFEILAKAPSFAAASDLFDMVVMRSRSAALAGR